ncbi:MAG: response regulator, partial [Asgard group archaeon]|nr:response regulator [Asgard group archaeon]
MCKILLVEDDHSTRSLLTKILSKEGFEIIEASDGEEGLELYEKV